jgi:hypothetical protein
MLMIAIHPRKLFIHAAILLAITGFVVEARRFEFLSPGQACVSCEGAGETRQTRWVDDGQVLDVRPCRFCDGSGLKDPWSERLGRFLPVLKVGLFALVFLGLLVGMLWIVKVVECWDCEGSGILKLEVTCPGEGVSVIEHACFFCEGRGRLPAVDRWVLRVFDRSEPEAVPGGPEAAILRRLRKTRPPR